jgi:hypothetical protein
MHLRHARQLQNVSPELTNAHRFAALEGQPLDPNGFNGILIWHFSMIPRIYKRQFILKCPKKMYSPFCGAGDVTSRSIRVSSTSTKYNFLATSFYQH